MENMLMTFRIGDENHYAIRNFMKSLPRNSKKLLDTEGYVGNLSENSRGFKKKNLRRFVVLNMPHSKDLDLEYFAINPNTSLNSIDDRLQIVTRFKQQDTDFVTGAYVELSQEGSIEDMVSMYREQSRKNFKDVLLSNLSTSDLMKRRFTRKRLIRKKGEIIPKMGNKIIRTYISMGLQTSDEKYLLQTTGVKGPYVGYLNE